MTLDGHEYSIGDTGVPFTIQSVSKPFVYGLALEDNGEEFVLSRVGVEPSGDAFNAISLDPATGIPSNPMINAGAIATAAMVKPGENGALARLTQMFSRYAGREVGVDEAVYRSESDTGHRNRAIAHLLKNFGIVDGDPEGAVDLYFRQCSVSMTCRDLAVMAACLANGGLNPVTGVRAVDRRYVESILSVMGSCGMYDYAGEWIYRVGMPAKSGVSGCVLAVLPGQLGIGVFSPRLDPRGNSVRGVQVCADLSRAYGLHMLSVPNLGRSAVRLSYDTTTVRSKRQRGHQAASALSDLGSRSRFYELQGDLVFASVEALSRQMSSGGDSFDVVGIDLKHVSRLGDGALSIFIDLLKVLVNDGKLVALSQISHLPELGAALAQLTGMDGSLGVFADKDLALEWCEDRLLTSAALGPSDEFVPLAENELCSGLDEGAIARLEAVTRPAAFAAGETVVRAGDHGESLYLLVRGQVSISIDLADGGSVRVATLSAGMAFGEMVMLGEKVRSANVRADSDVDCLELSMGDLALLGDSDPRYPRNDVRRISHRNSRATCGAQTRRSARCQLSRGRPAHSAAAARQAHHLLAHLPELPLGSLVVRGGAGRRLAAVREVLAGDAFDFG